jgi:hypothetical protein
MQQIREMRLNHGSRAHAPIRAQADVLRNHHSRARESEIGTHER